MKTLALFLILLVQGFGACQSPAIKQSKSDILGLKDIDDLQCRRIQRPREMITIEEIYGSFSEGTLVGEVVDRNGKRALRKLTLANMSFEAHPIAGLEDLLYRILSDSQQGLLLEKMEVDSSQSEILYFDFAKEEILTVAFDQPFDLAQLMGGEHVAFLAQKDDGVHLTLQGLRDPEKRSERLFEDEVFTGSNLIYTVADQKIQIFNPADPTEIADELSLEMLPNEVSVVENCANYTLMLDLYEDKYFVFNKLSSKKIFFDEEYWQYNSIDTQQCVQGNYLAYATSDMMGQAFLSVLEIKNDFLATNKRFTLPTGRYTFPSAANQVDNVVVKRKDGETYDYYLCKKEFDL